MGVDMGVSHGEQVVGFEAGLKQSNTRICLLTYITQAPYESVVYTLYTV